MHCTHTLHTNAARQVLFGSEASACKAALHAPGTGGNDDDMDATKTGEAFGTVLPPTQRRHAPNSPSTLSTPPRALPTAADPKTLDLKGATRLDLDDVNGEVVLVRWEKAVDDWHLMKRASQSHLSSRSPSKSRSPSQPKPPRHRRPTRERVPERGPEHSQVDVPKCPPVHGFQLEPPPHMEREVSPSRVEEGGEGATAAQPASWLHLASDDPENHFHEIFRYGDGDGGPDSSRLLLLTSIEGGQHKQPPLFKRLDSTACNPTC